MSMQLQRKIRVMIVDDSSFMRMAIRGILSRDADIEVVASAIDGADGVAKAASFKPDVITMDVEMPRMDGISAVRQIMAAHPTKIIMVSTLTSEGATATFDALEAGAADFITKPSDAPESQNHFKTELLKKIKAAVSFNARSLGPAPVGVPAARTPFSTAAHTAAAPHRPAEESRGQEPAVRRISCVGIGASTGGPVAVQQVISSIPADYPHPIVVAIHMPKAFTGAYAARLDSCSKLSVREAEEGDILKPGTVLVAPGGAHTTIARHGSEMVIRLARPMAHPELIYVPSVDLMIGSIAECCNGSALGVILTGMGADGLKGMQKLKEKGGATVVQDEATSTIYGMPRACIEKGVADQILPLDKIASGIGRYTR